MHLILGLIISLRHRPMQHIQALNHIHSLINSLVHETFRAIDVVHCLQVLNKRAFIGKYAGTQEAGERSGFSPCFFSRWLGVQRHSGCIRLISLQTAHNSVCVSRPFRFRTRLDCKD